MNDSAVRVLAQQNPIPNLTSVVGQTITEARDKIDSLTATLRALDKLTETLREHKVTVDVDLGVIGNAAAAARRDLERERPTTFELPR